MVAIEDEILSDTYGCPDCADGGASAITLTRNGVTTTHTYEFGNPPAVFEQIDDFNRSLFVALDACISNEYITNLDNCTVEINKGSSKNRCFLDQLLRKNCT